MSTRIYDPQADLFADYLLESAEDAGGQNGDAVRICLLTMILLKTIRVLVSRLMITCCAADASIVGFHVQVYPGIDLAAQRLDTRNRHHQDEKYAVLRHSL